jgi:phosphatidylserine decarboxylase
MWKSIKSVFVPIHPEGYPFLAAFAAATLLAGWLLPDVFFWLGVILTAWCAYFFRDPPRTTPVREGLVIAPADGRVSDIRELVPPPELDLDETPRWRVSIFMNVFDVHVNRAPVDGRIVGLTYIPGKFLNAELDKASTDNERQAFTLELEDGTRIGMVQIAGLVARRIVRFVNRDDSVLAGQRIGLIRFGSRVDVWLPPGVRPVVLVGQRTYAGETIIADSACELPAPQPRRS